MDDELEAIRTRKLAELQAEVAAEANASGEPLTLTDANFWDVVKANRVVLVDFWAAWCAPCRVVGPIVEAIGKDYAGRLTVGKLNVDENPRTPSQFGVQSIPTLLVFKGGEMVDAIVGAVPRPFLEKSVQRWV
jgi:thioredoxin 1